VKYFVSGEFFNQQGMFKNFSTDLYGNKSNSAYSRYAFRANLDFLLTNDLTLSLNLGTRFEERKGPNSDEYGAGYSEVMYQINHTPGWLFPVYYDVDGQKLYGGNSQNQNNIVGRLAEAGFYRQTNTINETNFIANYKMDWLTEGLSAKAMVSFDYDSWYRRLFTADFATYELLSYQNGLYDFAKFNNDTELAYAGDNQTTTMKIYMEYALNYARTFGNHDVTGLLLYNQNDYNYQADLAQRYQGLVGRVTYGYDNRYLAEVNFGYNGSENFMRGRRFGFFPSFSVGWNIARENFMEKYDWLTNLKLRFSYGAVGNDEYRVNGILQRFLYIPVWTQIGTDYTFGANCAVGGIYESQYPNYAVTWERAHKYNAGLDFAIKNRFLEGSIDVFHEKRTDILTPYLSRPEWVGVNMAAGNLGEAKNSGFEVELRHFNRINENFSYNVGLTYSHAKNEIISMDEPFGKTDYRRQAGHPIEQYFGLVSEGFITQADLNSGSLPVSSFGDVKVGDLKYKDMNADGFIDDRDVTFIGYSNIPENTYTLTLGAEWKNWAFSAMFQGVDHVSRYYDAEAMFAFVNGGKVKEIHLDRWNPALPEAENLANAKYPLLHYDSYGNHNQRLNSFFLKDGSFIRLKNIEVSYTIPKHFIEGIAESIRLYFNGSNLVTWDKLDGLIDPESNGSNRYPIMKTFNFGINVKF
jgi:TonB-linked SusC/RagA family outer membrane protein